MQHLSEAGSCFFTKLQSQGCLYIKVSICVMAHSSTECTDFRSRQQLGCCEQQCISVYNSVWSYKCEGENLHDHIITSWLYINARDLRDLNSDRCYFLFTFMLLLVCVIIVYKHNCVLNLEAYPLYFLQTIEKTTVNSVLNASLAKWFTRGMCFLQTRDLSHPG